MGQRAFQGDGVLRGQRNKVVFTACDGEYLIIGQGAADTIIAAAQHGEAGNAIVIGRYGQENLVLRVQYFRRCAGKGQIACIQRAVGVEIMIESNFKRCYVHHADGPHGRGFARGYADADGLGEGVAARELRIAARQGEHGAFWQGDGERICACQQAVKAILAVLRAGQRAVNASRVVVKRDGRSGVAAFIRAAQAVHVCVIPQAAAQAARADRAQTQIQAVPPGHDEGIRPALVAVARGEAVVPGVDLFAQGADDVGIGQYHAHAVRARGHAPVGGAALAVGYIGGDHDPFALILIVQFGLHAAQHFFRGASAAVGVFILECIQAQVADGFGRADVRVIDALLIGKRQHGGGAAAAVGGKHHAAALRRLDKLIARRQLGRQVIFACA